MFKFVTKWDDGIVYTAEKTDSGRYKITWEAAYGCQSSWYDAVVVEGYVKDKVWAVLDEETDEPRELEEKPDNSLEKVQAFTISTGASVMVSDSGFEVVFGHSGNSIVRCHTQDELVKVLEAVSTLMKYGDIA